MIMTGATVLTAQYAPLAAALMPFTVGLLAATIAFARRPLAAEAAETQGVGTQRAAA
jgi:hypothetical protein